MAKITLDAKTFQALASTTRLTVLRALDERRKTLTEIARDLELNKATVHEHLQLLAAAGLVKKRDDEGRKWIYYELTWTGQKILHPQETTTFSVLLGLSIAAAGGGVAMLGRALGLWLVSQPMPYLGVDDGADKVAITNATSPEPNAVTAGDGGGAGGATASSTATATSQPSATATYAPSETTPPSTAAQPPNADAYAVTSPPPHEGAAPAGHDFFDEGGWLGLAMLLAAIIFTTLALALRRHLRPAPLVPPDGPEELAEVEPAAPESPPDPPSPPGPPPSS